MLLYLLQRVDQARGVAENAVLKCDTDPVCRQSEATSGLSTERSDDRSVNRSTRRPVCPQSEATSGLYTERSDVRSTQSEATCGLFTERSDVRSTQSEATCGLSTERSNVRSVHGAKSGLSTVCGPPVPFWVRADC